MKKYLIKKLFIKRTLQMILAGIITIVVGYFLIKNNMIIVKKNTHTDRQVYNNINAGFEFKYPKTFSGNVRSPTTWPILVTIVSKNQNPIEIGCSNLKNISYSFEKKQGETNNGIKYLLYQGDDIGAGSLYSIYCYVIQTKNNYYVFDFEIRSHSGCGNGNCGAYCETPFEQECKDLNRAKDIQGPISQIVSTFRFIK